MTISANKYTNPFHWQLYTSKNMSGYEIFLFLTFAMFGLDMEIYGQMVKTEKMEYGNIAIYGFIWDNFIGSKANLKPYYHNTLF